jgi:hypothetical protein
MSVVHGGPEVYGKRHATLAGGRLVVAYRRDTVAQMQGWGDRAEAWGLGPIGAEPTRPGKNYSPGLRSVVYLYRTDNSPAGKWNGIAGFGGGSRVPMAGVVPMGNRRWGAGTMARGLIDACRRQPAGERYARGTCLLRSAGVSQHYIARDTPDAVPRKAIDTIIDAATQALNGGNHPRGRSWR